MLRSMTVAASHLLSTIRSRLGALLSTIHPLHSILRAAAFVALVIFTCGYVQKSSYPCEHVQPFLLPDDPNENIGLFRNEVPLEVRDEDEIRSAQIRRLSEVMGDLEERYGYDELKKGIRLGGQTWRASLLLHKLVSGQPLKVVMVGGSVSNGQRLYPTPEEKTYGQHLIHTLSTLFPARNGGVHKLMTATLSGSGSYVHHYCMWNIMRGKECGSSDIVAVTAETVLTRWGEVSGDISMAMSGDVEGCDAMVDAKQADLVLLDFAANDFVNMQPWEKEDMAAAEEEVLRHQESVLRQMYALPSGPLALFVNFGFASPNLSHMQRLARTSESVLDRLRAYYGVPSVSVLAAFSSKLTVFNETPECRGDFFCPLNEWLWDDIHPTSAGHLAISDLVLYALLVETTFLARWTSGNRFKVEPQPDQAHRNMSDDKVGAETQIPKNESGGRKLLQELETSVDKIESVVSNARSNALPHPLHPDNNVSNPYCKLAREWNVVDINGVWTMREHNFVANGRSKAMTVQIDFGSHHSFGVVYRRGHLEDSKKCGLNISVDGNQVAQLEEFWPKSGFNVWYLEKEVFRNSGPLGLRNVTLTPKGDYTQILAFIAE